MPLRLMERVKGNKTVPKVVSQQLIEIVRQVTCTEHNESGGTGSSLSDALVLLELDSKCNPNYIVSMNS